MSFIGLFYIFLLYIPKSPAGNVINSLKIICSYHHFFVIRFTENILCTQVLPEIKIFFYPQFQFTSKYTTHRGGMYAIYIPLDNISKCFHHQTSRVFDHLNRYFSRTRSIIDWQLLSLLRLKSVFLQDRSILAFYRL